MLICCVFLSVLSVTPTTLHPNITELVPTRPTWALKLYRDLQKGWSTAKHIHDTGKVWHGQGGGVCAWGAGAKVTEGSDTTSHTGGQHWFRYAASAACIPRCGYKQWIQTLLVGESECWLVCVYVYGCVCVWQMQPWPSLLPLCHLSVAAAPALLTCRIPTHSIHLESLAEHFGSFTPGWDDQCR